VLFISGESTGSTPGKRLNGKTLPDREIIDRTIDLRQVGKFLPGHDAGGDLGDRRADRLGTNGTVRLARGLTSIR